jgi:hypothetical protein
MCRESKSVVKWNNCNHVSGSSWLACNDCNAVKKRACIHWCSECFRAKRLCETPTDTDAQGHIVEIYTSETVDNARKRLGSASAKK